MLNSFAHGFHNTNRLVFVDTYTNYYFTKAYGQTPAAHELLPERLLAPLNRVHTASRAGESVAATDRATLYRAALELEQEVTVAPGIQNALAEIDCPILTTLLLKPIVRFRYFPQLTYFWFRNFSEKAERIAKAERSYEIAERVGWEQVVWSMRHYGVLPDSFFADPHRFVHELRCRQIRPG